MTEVVLSWGASARVVRVPAPLRVLRAPEGPALDLVAAYRRALAAPLGSAPLVERLARARCAALLVCDATRQWPRAAAMEAFGEALQTAGVEPARLCAVIAHGTHTLDANPPQGGYGPERFGIPCIPHRADDDDALAELGAIGGRTVRIARVVRDADLVISFGVVRPHNIAGFAGGAKMVLPGVASRRDVQANHALRTQPGGPWLGRVAGNAARAEMDRAGDHLEGRLFVLDAVEGPTGFDAVVAGAHREAHTLGVALGCSLLEVPAASAPIVLTSAPSPVSDTLYQLTKAIAPAAHVVEPGGTVIVAGACSAGLGDRGGLARIVALGVNGYLPLGVELRLVADGIDRAEDDWLASLARPLLRAESVERAIDDARARLGAASEIVALPDATRVLPVAPRAIMPPRGEP